MSAFADFAAAGGRRGGLNSTPPSARSLRVDIDARVARAWSLTPDDLQLMFRDFSENAVTPSPSRGAHRPA